jgi:hypothetical protein
VAVVKTCSDEKRGRGSYVFKDSGFAPISTNFVECTEARPAPSDGIGRK